ncbi:MAG: hypothetical protein AAGA10_12785 [Bacteroidota bacterium]
MSDNLLHSFLSFLLLFPLTLSAQESSIRTRFPVFEDALTLRFFSEVDTETGDPLFKLEDEEAFAAVENILSKYVVAEEDAQPGMRLQFPRIKDYFEANEFINPFFDGPGMPDAAPESLLDVLPGVGAPPPPNRSQSTATTSIDGVGRFLAKRFKEEIHVAFLERFRNQLEREPILRRLFPQTFTMLTYIDTYLYSGRIKMIGGAFNTDIDSMLFHVDNLISDPTIQQDLGMGPQDFLAFKTLFWGFQIAADQNPAEAIYEYTHLDAWEEVNPNLATGLNLVGILSEAFRSHNGLDVWVGPDALRSLKTDPVLRRLFLGLLYERVSPISFQIKKDSLQLDSVPSEVVLQDLMMSSFDDLLLDPSPLSVQQEIALGSFLQSGLGMSSSENTLIFDRETDFSRLVHNTIRGFNDLIHFLAGIEIKSDSLSQPLIPELTELANFTQTMERASPYAVNFFNHMKLAFQANKDTVLSRNFQDQAYFLGLAFMDLSKIFGELAQTLEEGNFDAEGSKYYRTAEKIFYYGTFVSTVLTTDDAEDVAEIIERFALPSGSSRIKRESPLNLSINAFVGPSFGWETPSLSKLGFRNEVMLFTAPIGVAASTRLWKNRRENGASLSLFLSALDLGAVTLFRLNDNNQFVSLPAAASFENVFAPGIHLILGFPDVPISAGIGFQRSASLRKISQDEVRVDPSAKYRLGAFIGVDIPLFNIYTNTSYTYNRYKFKRRKE